MFNVSLLYFFSSLINAVLHLETIGGDLKSIAEDFLTFNYANFSLRFIKFNSKNNITGWVDQLAESC